MIFLSHPQRPEMLIELTQASQEHEKIATSRFLLVYEEEIRYVYRWSQVLTNSMTIQARVLRGSTDRHGPSFPFPLHGRSGVTYI